MVLPYEHFATTVALITSAGPDGQPNVMACEWSMNVCWEPLRVMAVIHGDNLTHELIAATGEYGFSICADDQAALAHFAGSVSGRDQNKFAAPVFIGALEPARSIAPPLVRGGVIKAEVTVENQIDFGEYTGFVGQARHPEVDVDRKPLIWHKSGYHSLGQRIERTPET